MVVNRKSCLKASALLLVILGLAACEKKGGEGPAETAGKKIDQAVEQAGQAMDKAKESVKETAKEAVKKTEDAATVAADSAKDLVRGQGK